MLRRALRPLALLALLLGPAAARAQAPAEGNAFSDARLVAATRTVQPGEEAELGLWMTMREGWHVYWINPGDAGTPPSLTWTLPEGVTAGPFRWPFPERLLMPPLASYGYEKTVLLPFNVTVPATYAAATLPLKARVDWLVCADVCLPAEATVSLTLPVSPGTPAPDPVWAPRFAETRQALPVAVPGWTATAAPADSGFALRLTPPPGWSEELDGAYFFADSAGVAQHAAPQRLTRAGAAFELHVPGSEFASARPTRLRGIVVLPEGRAWDAAGTRALAVEASLSAPAERAERAGVPPSAGGVTLGFALVLAFFGGVLLNLMPCVFPVLAIKLLGFVDGRADDRAALRQHGLAFGAGVVVSFWALAGLLLVLRASGESLGWGFQLQRPGVVAALAALLFGLALNLAGVFEVGGRLAARAGQLDRHRGLGGAFASGVLATLVATPCTAPFMGIALGFALTQPALAALLVFTALGVGMALPYMLLASFPRWLQRLPRPGPWMETLRQALAFPLLLTVVWLVWVFGQQTGVDGLAWLLAAFVLFALAAWLYGRAPSWKPRARAGALALAVLGLVGAVLSGVSGARQDAPTALSSADTWAPFDAAEVAATVASGQPVFVDFTAAWCLSCQVNKRVALSEASVAAAFAARGVRTFRADWTRRDPAITAALERFGRSGVPLYVLYPGGHATPVLLPAVLTPGIVRDALNGLPPRSNPSL